MIVCTGNAGRERYEGDEIFQYVASFRYEVGALSFFAGRFGAMRSGSMLGGEMKCRFNLLRPSEL